MASPVYADLIRPAGLKLARAFDAALVAGFSLFIALCAQIAIPLPFTPVPVTLQTFAVILTGFLLGSGRGALATVAYVAEGTLGLPFFAGGASGIARLLGPTGGYLVGLVLAAFVVGLLTERRAAGTWWGSLLTLVVGDLILFVPGAAWLGTVVGMNRAVSLGFLPFVAGDALKVLAAWGIVRATALIAARVRPDEGRTP